MLNLPYFQRHLPEDLAKVNEVINRTVQSDVALISQIGTYIISAGGKRLRPIMTILAGKAVGYDDGKLYSLAAMVEFIHTSALLRTMSSMKAICAVDGQRQTICSAMRRQCWISVLRSVTYRCACQLILDSQTMRMIGSDGQCNQHGSPEDKARHLTNTRSE